MVPLRLDLIRAPPLGLGAAGRRRRPVGRTGPCERPPSLPLRSHSEGGPKESLEKVHSQGKQRFASGGCQGEKSVSFAAVVKEESF